jgi:hypothetical protein
MNQWTEMGYRLVLIGVGATVVMDAWLMFLKWLKVPTLNFAFIGRWIGNGLGFRWAREGIAKAPPVRGELQLGWLAHYATGVLFAALLVGVCGMEWSQAPTLVPALMTGIATVLIPLFIMQPAMGAGIASSRTPRPLLNCLKSLANHAVFGIGLYLAALLAARLA